MEITKMLTDEEMEKKALRDYRELMETWDDYYDKRMQPETEKEKEQNIKHLNDLVKDPNFKTFKAKLNKIKGR